MSNPSLYDEDILLWSEQQAEVIRRLGQTRHELSNELDVENVAEEIESVGRSELAAVKSYIRLIFLHVIKLHLETASDAKLHWESEIIGFHSDMIGRYSPSMCQRIDVDDLGRSARKQALLANQAAHPQQNVADLPVKSPFALDDVLSERIDGRALAQLLQQ
jgi:hypothetical protein